MTQAVRLQHHFNVTRERVYDAFLDPEKAGKFLFATPTGEMVRVEMTSEVGGTFLFVERRDGEDFEHFGKFMELERPSRLVFDFQVPKAGPQWTRVSIDIVELAEGCELTLTHDGVPPDVAERAACGWQKILQTLERLLAE
jgi:uncharacterized protein YndB with AHSA1/START domain